MRASDAACLECHADSSLEMEKAGRQISLYVEGAKLAGSRHAALTCVECHEGFDAEAMPHRQPMTSVNCLSCHEDLGSSHAFHPKIGELDQPETAPGLNCVGCHGGHEVTGTTDERFAFAPAQQSQACGQCHAEATRHFLHSAHGQETGLPYPDCLTCHRTDLVNGHEPTRELKISQSKLCMSCHVDEPATAARTRMQGGFVASWGRSVHGQALENGNARAANCVDCHGSHDMSKAMVADSLVNKLHIPQTCQRCHEAESREFMTGSHGQALYNGEMESPVCTDCHGEHAIFSPKDPQSLASSRNLSAELCGDCHGSVKLTRRYGISSDRFKTFADSFHGLAVRGGSVSVVNCASCHGAHSVLRSNNPLSPVHKDNLAKTCGHCHPGANELFAVGSVHVSLSPIGKDGLSPDRGNRIIQIIATIYVWGIVSIVGGMLIHNGLDFFKKVRRKIRHHRESLAEANGPHRLYLRMSFNESLQHGLLATSFIILVITGFMLRFPEAWWVSALQKLSPGFFEWRGILHRIAALAMVAAGLWHILYVILTERGRQLIHDLWPRWHDLSDMWGVLRYNLGLVRHKPLFGRFSYMEKAEYWALIWGAILMTVTGILLWADITTMNLIGKLGFDIARVVHYYEAILATFSIIVWHFYFVIFNPEVYPMNVAWLTGRLSEEEMAEEHPRELERLKNNGDKPGQPS